MITLDKVENLFNVYNVYIELLFLILVSTYIFFQNLSSARVIMEFIILMKKNLLNLVLLYFYPTFLD